MNRSKDTIDLALEELERASVDAKGEPYIELSQSKAVGMLIGMMLDSNFSFSSLLVETVEELTSLTVTTPNLLDTALYHVRNTKYVFSIASFECSIFISA